MNDEYICEDCNKKFSTKGNLKKHINKHCKIINEQKEKDDDILKLIFNKIEIMEKEVKKINFTNNVPLENFPGSFMNNNVDNNVDNNDNKDNEDIGYINKNINDNDDDDDNEVNNNDNKVVNGGNIQINFNKYINIEPIQGVTVRMRYNDGYINATELCKAAKKEIKHWNQLTSTKEYLEVLSSEVGIPTSELVKIKKGRNFREEQGTWVHPDIAINIAQWCSPLFAVKVSNIVKRYYTGDITLKNEIKENKEKLFISSYKLTKAEIKKKFGNDKRYIYLGKFMYNGKRYYKYGKTNTIHTRINGLFSVYDNFEFVKIWECNKNDDAEKDVSSKYISNGKKRTLNIKNDNREEIIEETEEHEEEMIFEIDEIVKQRNEEDKQENIKKYKPEITNELKLKELDFKMSDNYKLEKNIEFKKLENEQLNLQIELKKLSS